MEAPPAYAQPTPSSAPMLSNETLEQHSSGDRAKQSLARFGNPYATNTTWSPSTRDGKLRKLPSLDLTMRLQQKFARMSGDNFSPSSPSMRRPVPTIAVMGTDFEPYQIQGKGDLASDGFQSTFLGVIMAVRDVSSADWFCFVQDMTVASRLSVPQEALAGITPITKRLSLPGHLVTKMIRYTVVRKREPLIFKVVEEWNARFFAFRGIDVFIHNGTERLTATAIGEAIPPLESKYWKNLQGYQDDGRVSARYLERRTKQRGHQKEQQSNANYYNNKKADIMMLVVAHRETTSGSGPAALAQAVLSTENGPSLPPTYDEQAQRHAMETSCKN
ncbi:hypothetical protein CBS101457_001323 [Exobasidium rhododendri]|nr:hypothetical protein CBS101457_001323 [Exobasidium rhododendri]